MNEPRLIYRDDVSECWHGSALDPEHVAAVMAGRKADLVCVDAPYSERTHEGHKIGKMTADRAAAFARRAPGQRSDSRANSPRERAYAARRAARADGRRKELAYEHWEPTDVDAFVEIWAPQCSGWFVSITDDVLAPAWRGAYEVDGLYPFAPLPLVETGSRVRMSGDGPSSWTCWIVVGRPRHEPYSKWGTLPGAYVQPGDREMNSAGGSDRIVGGKPLRSMMAIVRDYSRPGDLVLDPCSGAGTTGEAAKSQGRRFIGMDLKLEHAELTARRLESTRVQERLSFAEVGVEQLGLLAEAR